MKVNLGILSSDALNRDNYLIAFEVLEKSVANSALEGMPSLIDHDFHRPLGWIFPYGVLVEPKISKTIGNFHIATTEEDYQLISGKIQSYHSRLQYESCKDYIEDFKTILGLHFSTEGRFLYRACVSYYCSNIVTKIFPDLFTHLDKSGLIFVDEILKEFDYVGQGTFKQKSGELCIFCHQFFNRNLSLLNNFNTYFLDEFFSLNSSKDLQLRIAIDPNLVGLSKSLKGVLEFDHWWGPKFNDDISSLPSEVTRYESSEDQKFFSNVLGTEFWWKKDQNERTLEIEEIRERPTLGVNNESYGCRYIHSIYNTDQKEFVHFDGAIRLYTEEQMLERWDTNINKAGKNTDYTKLFRVDGKLGLADWKKLCILFYKGNPLLYEYFGVKEEHEALMESTKSADPLTHYLPNRLGADDGVRLFASYHQKWEDYSQFNRKLIHPDVISLNDGTSISVAEYDIIEIKKFLERNGEGLSLPENLQFVKAFDSITNYPTILHGSVNSSKLVHDTLKAFREILQTQLQKVNVTVSFTLAWEMEKFEARLSIFGKASEIIRWFAMNETIPVKYEEFRNWLSKQQEWIYKNYKYSGKDFAHLLRNDGIFYLKRTPVNADHIEYKENDKGFYFEVTTKGDQELAKLVEDKIMAPSQLALIKRASCSKTHENYFESSTSKYLDSDVKIVIEEVELLQMFWTERN